MQSSKNGVLRLLDANMNRALEGIRVLEETSRMLFDDCDLTKRIKYTRHALIQIIKDEKDLDSLMLFARGSEHDVLRNGNTSSAKTRTDTVSIVRANASRSQEAIRVLEEYTVALFGYYANVATDGPPAVHDVLPVPPEKLLCPSALHGCSPY